VDEGMRRGLTDAGEWLFIGKINSLKLPRRGKTGWQPGLARLDRTRQGRISTRRRTGPGLQTQGDYKESK